MISDPALREALDEAAETYPYPIAAACAEVRDTEPRDDWHEWELLSRDVLTPVLTYLSHLLLSDLVATGREPARLFHRIEAILSRPLAGHYAGFLRETATYYREEEVETAVPELVDFLLAAEVDGALTDSGRPLLGDLVDFRNRWAHGRIENEDVVENSLRQIRTLIGRLLSELAFLAEAPLTLEDGTELMGRDPDLPDEPMPLVTVTAEGVSLRPLLLKLEGRELSVLAEADLRDRSLTYRSLNSYTQFDENEDGEEATQLFEELKSLLQEVRSLEAELPTPDLESFRERAAVQTNRMRTLYGKENLGKYDEDLYIPRPEWEAEGGHFWDFLESEKTLLAIDGEQGTGKSALAARLAELSEERGHAVWFLNAQRFTFAEVSWSGNPFPRYFADRLNYEAPLDAEGVESLAEETDEEERIVLFVDGINEIGALSNKWNRFKAISQFLEWAEEVAHPKLKVVLTFRTEAYTRFNYLEAEDVPNQIEEISFQPESSSGEGSVSPKENGDSNETGEIELSWVHTLEPFTEEQARELYERLQNLEERGMAPDMMWEKIQKGLGEKVKTFVTNPLLFTIFLQAHDGESEIISTDQEELFTRYANGVTGARERQEWPWWKQAYYFLKDGNITKKERFLADCVEKASENGTPSFLESDLDPERSKRDERITSFLANPEENDKLDQLQEGGLLVQEPIYETAEETFNDQRIAFTSELLKQAMGRISRVVNTRFGLKNTLSIFISTFFVIFLVGFLSALFNTDYTLSGVLYLLSLSIYTLPSFCIFLLFLVHFPLLNSVVTPVRVGVFEYRIYEITFTEQQDILNKVIYPVLFLTVFFIVYFDMSGIYTCLYLFLSSAMTISIVAIPQVNNFFVRDSIPHPPKIKRSTFSSLFSSISETSFSISPRVLLSFISINFLLVGLSYYFSGVYLLPTPADTITNTSELFSSFSILDRYIGFFQGYEDDYFFYATVIFSSLSVSSILIVRILSFVGPRVTGRVYREKINEPTYSKEYLYSPLIALYVVLMLVGASGWIPQGPPLSKPFSTKGEVTTILDQRRELLPHVDYVGDISASFHTASLPLSDIKALRPVALSKLTLSASQLRKVSLSRWAGIARLILVGDSIDLQPDDAVSLMQVLEIRGHLSNFSQAADLYPTLSTLKIPEPSVQNAGGLPDFWKGSLIHIQSDGSPHLDWLRPRSSSYVFEFSHPPTEETQNLSLLRHVSLPAGKLDPDILHKMNNLRWLYLTNSPCDQIETPAAKQKWCAELKQIESSRPLNIDHSSDGKTLFSKRASAVTSDSR